MLDFAMFDLESHFKSNYNHKLWNLKSRRVPVFIYPHSVRPVYYDGIVTPWPHTTCTFVHAEGHKEILKMIKYPTNVEVTGWTYSPILPFRKIKNVRRILFAPIHPIGNSFLPEKSKKVNRIVLKKLIRYSRSVGAELTVRYIKSLEANGLGEEEGVIYKQVKARIEHSDIGRSDLVVGHQTFAYLAVALGTPTLMMAEWIPPWAGGKRYVEVKNWDLYRDFISYPYDILRGNVNEVIKLATSKEASDWKEKFIGSPFDGRKFIKIIKKYT